MMIAILMMVMIFLIWCRPWWMWWSRAGSPPTALSCRSWRTRASRSSAIGSLPTRSRPSKLFMTQNLRPPQCPNFFVGQDQLENLRVSSISVTRERSKTWHLTSLVHLWSFHLGRDLPGEGAWSSARGCRARPPPPPPPRSHRPRLSSPPLPPGGR